MINPNELRIGNYFLDQKSNIQKADCINRLGDFVVNDSTQPYGYLVYKNNECESVPITDKILTDFGFEECGVGYKKRINVEMWFGYNIIREKAFILDANEKIIVQINVNCVHRLQNLFFELVGEELILP